TAELPDLYAAGEYDLAGFAVGVVERRALIDGRRVAAGDRILGLASSGLHANGYALARRIVFDVLGLTVEDPLPGTGRTVAQELLEPTRIYARAVQALLRAADVHAMAHITGGGLPGNLPRVLPEDCGAVLRRQAWPVPAVFETLRRAGGIEAGRLPARLAVVVSDREQAPALGRAARHGAPALSVSPKDHGDRAAYDRALRQTLHAHGVELVCLAGFLRILGPELIRPLAGRVM